MARSSSLIGFAGTVCLSTAVSISMAVCLSIALSAAPHDAECQENTPPATASPPASSTAAQAAKPKKRDTAPRKPEAQPVSLSRYRGWDYLVGRLRERGVEERDLVVIYQSPKMPRFSLIQFNLAPRENPHLYRHFSKPSFSLLGAQFARDNQPMFDDIESSLKVPREVVSAILVIESGIGKNTGKELVVHRLSRLASVCDPDNLRHNYIVQKKKDPTVTFEMVRDRCIYLETTFLPEIPALIEIGKRTKTSPLKIRGSSAGAFGLPQFLPSAFIRFGMDGDRNGAVSLYHPSDAAWSAANYLSSFGYRDDIPVEEKRAVIWRYNKSDAYIDAVLGLSVAIRAELDAAQEAAQEAAVTPSADETPDA
mgnify:CR=1 FL=1